MKPHEETWRADGALLIVEEPFAQVAEFFELPAERSSPERAKLAAQAPAMARLMLEFASIPFGKDDDPVGGVQEFQDRARAILREAGALEVPTS